MYVTEFNPKDEYYHRITTDTRTSFKNICLHTRIVEFSITSIWFWKISLRINLLTTFTSTIYAPFTISTRRLELKGYKTLTMVILKLNEDLLFRFRFLKSSFSVNNLSSYQGKYSLQMNIRYSYHCINFLSLISIIWTHPARLWKRKVKSIKNTEMKTCN